MSFVNILERPGIERQGLCFTVGCPGAGKSTWAAANRTDETLVVEADAFRIALFGSKQAYFDHPSDRRTRSRVLTSTALGAMRNWSPGRFLISNTNVRPDLAAPYMNFALRNGLPVYAVVFDAPLELLLERNRLRPENDFVPPKRIIEMHEEMQNPDNQWWKTIAHEIITCEGLPS